jgi:hypothetical protein
MTAYPFQLKKIVAHNTPFIAFGQKVMSDLTIVPLTKFLISPIQSNLNLQLKESLIRTPTIAESRN